MEWVPVGRITEGTSVLGIGQLKSLIEHTIVLPGVTLCLIIHQLLSIIVVER